MVTENKVYYDGIIDEIFSSRGFTRGKEDEMPIYYWRRDRNDRQVPKDLTPGHYVCAYGYGDICLSDIPDNCLSRSFFLHALSGVHHELIEFVKQNSKKFDRQFYKDIIVTNEYSLKFENNIFDFMPLEYIDEEMVYCALDETFKQYHRRGDNMEWFLSVYRRKPEVLTENIYLLGARCFATKYNGKNEYLEITPKEYRTEEYYMNMCINNKSRVMDDIPEEILTTNFLIRLINLSPSNISCFSEEALEKSAPMAENGIVKFWQAAIINDGFGINDIPLNDERIEFFLSRYEKDSFEYDSFKRRYKEYLKRKNSKKETEINNEIRASEITLALAMLGRGTNEAIDAGTKTVKDLVKREEMVPINCSSYIVPEEYRKKYDSEEYLLEIYNKIGIQVIDEADRYYYKAILPENIKIIHEDNRYYIADSEDNKLICYYDLGPFYDRDVNVEKIYITL